MCLTTLPHSFGDEVCRLYVVPRLYGMTVCVNIPLLLGGIVGCNQKNSPSSCLLLHKVLFPVVVPS